MPELPEVETTRRGILPVVVGATIGDVQVWQPRLRCAVPSDLRARLRGDCIVDVERRGKYLLLRLRRGTLLIHLGMSGSLRIVASGAPRRTHDHIEFLLASGECLRYHDPRRFGVVTWWAGFDLDHPLLVNLGVEPLDVEFSGEYLWTRARGRKCAIKPSIMDANIVVGVGNIYANEALFLAGISPIRAAGRIAKPRLEGLVESVKAVLTQAIAVGGTTLRDFVNSSGEPGYFKQQLNVYDRVDAPCLQCGTSIRQRRLAQRSTYYCPRCQK